MAIEHTPVSLAQPYIDGLAKNEIRIQHCTACGQAQTFAHDACQLCGAESLVWKMSAGRGIVYAATIVARAPSDVFRPLAPYTLVVVEMEEGARIMGHADPEVRIGDRVVASFFAHQGQTLIRFEK
jgi:uncharacterized OB-fold protein